MTGQRGRVFGKKGLGAVICSHTGGYKIQIGIFQWTVHKGSPLILSRAARFARLKCEVGAEDFLEGGFFGGTTRTRTTNACPTPPVRAFKTFADLVDRQTPYYQTVI